ncbi:MAG: PEP-CTERM sorting domain-containing protein [Thermoguttaceae bacterium]|nr:PEP-CTERM sorting domain-containing protein [Thermoguttaceae bacterium]
MNEQRNGRTWPHVLDNLSALGLILVIIGQAILGSATAETLTWNRGGGSWAVASYWEGVDPQRVPLITDDTVIDNAGNAAVRQSGSHVTRSLYLGNSASGSGTLAWRTPGSAGDMHVDDDLYVGNEGTGYVRLELDSASGKTLTVGDDMFVGTTGTSRGYVIHEAGTVHVGDRLAIASGSSTQGTYTISGEAELIVNRDNPTTSRYLFVGNSGTGTLNQHGGTVTVGTYLRIAEGSASHGAYNMTDGLLDVSGGYSIILGRRNDGTFIQSGGTVLGPTGSQGIYLGYEGHGVGEWQLSGSGYVNSGRFLRIGQGAEGIFTQTGGAVVVPTDAVLGYSADSVGTYTISAGTLDVDGTLFVGSGGMGMFHIIGDQASIEVDGYSQNADSMLKLTINGISPINVDGTISLAGLLDVEFTGVPSIDDVFPIFINDGDDLVSGIFTDMPEGYIFPLAGSYMDMVLTYQANLDGGPIGNDIALFAVPEPSTFLLLLLGITSIFASVRSRRG